MKEVLISIQPEWCELIANGTKTVEVRKTKPKLNTPFKCYIYCTKGKQQYLQSRSNMFFYLESKDFIGGHGAGLYTRLNGKVIGEFLCNETTRIAHCGYDNRRIELNIVDENLTIKKLDEGFLSRCQLSYSDIEKYANGGDVYGWHISDLVIYDEPKNLSEFKKINRECWYADLGLAKRDCLECKNEECYVSRPPQSWCYVEGTITPNC